MEMPLPTKISPNPISASRLSCIHGRIVKSVAGSKPISCTATEQHPACAEARKNCGVAWATPAIPRTQVKIGLSLAVIPVSVLAFAVPDHLIDLCMMETMHCHTVMEPAVTVLSLLNVLLAAADIYVYQKGENG